MKKIVSITLLAILLSTQLVAQKKDTLNSSKNHDIAPIPIEAFASEKRLRKEDNCIIKKKY